MKWRRDEFRDHIVTERESWILDNKDKNPNLSVEQNAAMIEPGMDFAPESFRRGNLCRGQDRAGSDCQIARQRCVEEKNHGQ